MPPSEQITNVHVTGIDDAIYERFKKEMEALGQMVAQVRGTMDANSYADPDAIVKSGERQLASHSALSPPVGATSGPSRPPSANALDSMHEQALMTNYGSADVMGAMAGAHYQEQAAQEMIAANVDPGAPKLPGRVSRVASATGRVASGLPVVGPIISQAMSAEHVGQAAAFSIGNAVMNNAGQSLENMWAVGNPMGYSSMGMNENLAGSSSMIEIPGTGIGFRDPFSGEAFHAQASAATQAIGSSFSGGLNLGQAYNIGQRWSQAGYRKGQGDFNNLTEWEREMTKDNEELTSIFDSGAVQSLTDQITRHGTASLDDVGSLLEGMGDAAAGARISLEDMVSGVNAVSERLSNFGLTKMEGAQAAQDFTSITGFHPELLNQLMENPMWQAQAMAQTGIAPEAQGLLARSPGAVTGITGDMIDQLRSTMGGVPGKRSIKHPGWTETISGREQEDAYISNLTGLPTDTLANWEQYEKRNRIQGSVSSMGAAYGEEIERLQKRYSGAALDRRINNLDTGTGRYAGQNLSLTDIEKQIGKKNSGFTVDQERDIMEADPAERGKLIKRAIERNQERRTSDDRSKTTVAFTGMAEKVLKEVIPGYEDKASGRAANRAEGTKNSQYTSSQAPNPAGLLSGPNPTSVPQIGHR